MPGDYPVLGYYNLNTDLGYCTDCMRLPPKPQLPSMTLAYRPITAAEIDLQGMDCAGCGVSIWPRRAQRGKP